MIRIDKQEIRNAIVHQDNTKHGYHLILNPSLGKYRIEMAESTQDILDWQTNSLVIWIPHPDIYLQETAKDRAISILERHSFCYWIPDSVVEDPNLVDQVKEIYNEEWLESCDDAIDELLDTFCESLRISFVWKV